MLFLSHFRSKRDLPLDFTVDEIKKKIDKNKLSTYDEYFKDKNGQYVKPYFDSDARYVHEHEVDDVEKSRVFGLFKENVCKVMQEQDGFNECQILFGERHGFDVKHPERPHKISYRAWILGWKVRYPLLRQMILDKNLQGDTDGRLDDSVYKATEQLLGCVYACKGSMMVNKKKVNDLRVLEPIGVAHPYKDYLVQYLEGNEKVVVWNPEPLNAQGQRSAIVEAEPGASDGNPESHESLAELLDIFVVDRADNRSEWVNIGHHLKAISDTNFGVWDAWSSKSAKYTSPTDNRQVWDSIRVKAHFRQALNYLRSKAKHDNEDRFLAYIADDENSHILEIIKKRGSHLSIAKYIQLWHKYDILVISAKKQNPLYYSFNGNTWDERDQVTYISKLICESIIPKLQRHAESFERKTTAKTPRKWLSSYSASFITWRITISVLRSLLIFWSSSIPA